MSVCVWEGESKIEIITLPIVLPSITRQRCVFARDGDEHAAEASHGAKWPVNYFSCECLNFNILKVHTEKYTVITRDLAGLLSAGN